MSHALRPHPDYPCSAVSRIEAEVVRQGSRLTLRYALAGAIGDLTIPAPTDPVRTDELWRHTCFEAFVRTTPGDAYVELNLAPSTAWAAYRFTGYREGMAPAHIAAPRIEVLTTASSLALTAAFDLTGLGDDPWRFALSAVIEDAAGARSYWALAHPPGRPNFHHAAGFVLQLPPT